MKTKLILSISVLSLFFSNSDLKAQLYSPNGAPITTNPTTENVGIGVLSPLAKLHINGGDLNLTGWNLPQNNSILNIGFNTTDKTNGISNYGMSLLSIYPIGGGNFGPGIGLSGYYGVSFFTGSNEKMRIDGGGNVGIGITNPKNKLDVNGTVHAKEVRVDLLGWSDYVFEKDYNLNTLEEVEKHIAEKGHLPNIPSASEVVGNGINLGEMDAKLLEKIEELTLYSIELNKKNKEQEFLLKSQAYLLQSVIERLEKIEKTKQK